MADKYTLTPQLEGMYKGKPTTGTRILDFLKGKRRWPESRLNEEDYYRGVKEAGELPGLSGTFVRKKEDTMDERKYLQTQNYST